MIQLLWIVAGLGCVALGGVGVVVPGLPSTIFFIGAAACFTRSSPRLERWVLGLPGVGQLVRDHRAGLGMPRRAKVVTIASIAGFSAVAIAVASRPVVGIGVGVLAAIGIVVVTWHVPTREHVLDAPVRERGRWRTPRSPRRPPRRRGRADEPASGCEQR